MTLNNVDSRPVLIAYDGSDFAKVAVADAAGQLGPGRKAIVLTVWEPLEELPFLGIRGVASDAEAVQTVVAETRAGAEQVAKEGAKLASEAGFEAHAETASGDPAWRQIVEVADERDAGLIVLGSRGRSGLSYVLLGSVATAVSQHSKRSVLIVHSGP
ncbi:MAG TPA: universal stress protein [Solirubrobacterales bacterium]|nr:universal stress protein [Solirubrobacterales bacterium]